MSVSFWYLSKVSHLWLHHVSVILYVRFQTANKKGFCLPVKPNYTACNLNCHLFLCRIFGITPQLSLRIEQRAERKTEDVESGHKDSTVAKHLPLNGPWLKLQTEHTPKRVIEQENLHLCPFCQQMTSDQWSPLWWGLPDTHTHTYTETRQEFLVSPRQVLIKTAKPFFSSSSCALLGWGQETEYERKSQIERWRFVPDHPPLSSGSPFPLF